MKCSNCGASIPPARLEIVPDTEYCVRCAEKLGPKKRIGFMVSTASKGTAATLVAIDPDDAEAMRRAQRAHRRSR